MVRSSSVPMLRANRVSGAGQCIGKYVRSSSVPILRVNRVSGAGVPLYR